MPAPYASQETARGARSPGRDPRHPLRTGPRRPPRVNSGGKHLPVKAPAAEGPGGVAPDRLRTRLIQPSDG